MQNYKLQEFLVILLRSCVVIGYQISLVCTQWCIFQMSLKRICHVNCNEMKFLPVSVLMPGGNIGAILQILISGGLIPMADWLTLLNTDEIL